MMETIAKRTLHLLLAFLLLTAASTMAQQSQTPKKGTTPTTSEPSGENLFNTYCAVCHGKDGKGNGPAAAALKAPPSNLTTLGQRHGGKFPTDYVASVLQYGVEDVTAHGSKEMPIWGPLLSPSGSLRKDQERPLAEAREIDSAVAAKIHSLSQYIESLQAK
jgi:mono/diheme cytochrome c family protein